MLSESSEETQKFELLKLLFEGSPPVKEVLRKTEANTEREIVPFASFEARFQSFIDQISSYLHSGVKEGFFTHFFLGSFATVLDTEINKELNIKNLYYGFDNQRNLKIVAGVGKDKVDKVKIFVFSEIQKGSSIEKNPEFTKNEWKNIKEKHSELANIKEEPKFTLIKINKDIKERENVEKQYQDNKPVSKVTVSVENDRNLRREDTVFPHSAKSFIEIKKQLGDSEYLEDYIAKLSDPDKEKIEKSFKDILTHIKSFHTSIEVPSNAYATGAREANQHGFVAGIFDNFRYRYNARIYLEQFAGRGYADIILLVRGPKRGPILIELKAGLSGNEVTAELALKQAERYADGCQLKKMRLVTSAEDILCVGLNLDFPDAFKTNLVSIQQQELFPVIENILNVIYEQDDPGYIEKKIKELVSKEYSSLPPTSEKSDAHYLGLFFLGQSLLLDQVLGSGIKKHVFVKKHEAELTLTRASRKKTIKEILFSDKSSLVSMIFMPSIDYKKVVLLNIIFIHKDEDKDTAKDLESAIKINIPIDLYQNSLKDQKIVDVKLTFDLRKKQNNKTPTKTFLVTSVKTFQSYDAYDSRKIKNFNGQPKPLNPENKLIELFNKTLRSQKYTENALKFSDKLLSSYEDLLNKIGYLVFPFKLLIKKEAHFQAVLHGLFDYYSDIKLKEGVRELVLTEFQTGAGERIDMMIQIIGVSKDNINKYKEYIPVGLELKYTTGNFSEVQKNELKKQMSRYVSGKAIKSITDGRKIAVIGVVFCNNPPNEDSLILTYKGDETVETLSTRSSIMLPPRPDRVDALTQNLASNIDSQPSTSGGGKSGTEPNTSWGEKVVGHKD